MSDFDARLLSGIGVLRAVINAGSFGRAGDAIGLTQPAVSRAIARLEERVGIRIFNRTARAISLTDEGRRFHEQVEPLLAGIEDAAMQAGRSRVAVRGRLRVNVDGTFGHFVLAPRLNDLLDRYPELSVELFARDTIGDFVGEGMDVAVRFGALSDSALRATLLLDTRVLTCASPAYLRRHGTPSAPADLETGHTCVLIRDPASGRPFDWEFTGPGTTVPFAARGRLIVNDTGSLVAACRGGAGVAQLLDVYAKPLLARGEIVQILPDWSEETFPLFAYYRPSPLTPAKVTAFLSFVEDLLPRG